MKKKIYLPRTAEELKNMNHKKQTELWTRYINSPYERQFRALWYYIACENANLKVERKHLTKLEKYAEHPDECMIKVYKTKYNLHSGTEIIKTYRGREYKVTIAKEICGIKVSGFDFFGLNNKRALKEATHG